MLINGIPLFVTIDREKYKDRFHQLDAKEGLMLLKQRSVIEKEAAIAVPHRPHLLEMGIYKGGSVILYDQLFEPDRLFAVELDRNRIPALDQYIQTNRRSERVKPYFGINQASKTQMTALLSANFPKRDTTSLLTMHPIFTKKPETRWISSFPIWLQVPRM